MLKEVLVRLSVVAFVCCLSMTAHAMADQKSHVNVPAGDLTAGLELLAKQSGAEFVYRADQLKGLRTPGVAGDLTPKEAVTQLLIGTPLQLRMDPSGAMLIAPARANTTSDASSAAGGDQTQEGKRNSSGGFLLAQATPGQTSGPSTVEEQGEQPAKKKAVQLEEIVVTGSRIPLSTKEGAQPVRTYSREEIETSGRTTVADFLNTLPDVAINSVVAANASFGQTTVQLHGLPVGTTLVLLNGRRVETNLSSFFDLSNIPVSAVEKVEVLPIGGSAIYGSDALAGTVNIILRTAFDGVEFNSKYGHADGTSEFNADFAYGKQLDSAGVSVIVSYQSTTELNGSERALTSNPIGPPPAGTPNLLGNTCYPGNVFSLNGQNLPGLNSTTAGIPNGLSGIATQSTFLATAGISNMCSQLDSYGAALIPAIHKLQSVVSAHYEFNPAVDLFTEILLSREGISADYFNISSFGFTLAAGNPYNPFGEDVGVSFINPNLSLGQHFDTTLIRPTVGVRGNAFGNWLYEITGTVSRDYDTLHQDRANFAALIAALSSSSVSTAYNPFTSAAPASPQVLQGLIGAPRDSSDSQRLTSGQAILKGPLFDLPSGTVRVVLGGEYDSARLFNEAFGQTTLLSRRTYAGFGEVRVPLIGSASNPEVGDTLAVSGAIRYDHSNDFGGKTTGQGGIEWRPIRGLLVRGGYATSYQAPQLYQIGGQQLSFPGLGQAIDPFRGNAFETFDLTVGSNRHLSPETGEAMSLGFVYSSETLKGLEISSTLFRIKLSDYIGIPGTQTIVNNPSLYPGFVQRGAPTAADIANGYPGAITSVSDIYANYGSLSVNGLNFDAKYRVQTNLGQFTPSISITDTTKWTSALVPGQPQISYLSQATGVGAGFAPRYKGTAALGWDWGPYAATVDGRFTGRYRDYQENGPSSAELGGFWYWDGNFRYSLGQAVARSKRYLHGSYVELGGVNVLNRQPQYASNYFGYDYREADIRGRFLYVRIGGQW